MLYSAFMAIVKAEFRHSEATPLNAAASMLDRMRAGHALGFVLEPIAGLDHHDLLRQLQITNADTRPIRFMSNAAYDADADYDSMSMPSCRRNGLEPLHIDTMPALSRPTASTSMPLSVSICTRGAVDIYLLRQPQPNADLSVADKHLRDGLIDTDLHEATVDMLRVSSGQAAVFRIDQPHQARTVKAVRQSVSYWGKV